MMKPFSRMSVLLLFGGFFQRLLFALMEGCCLFSVFTSFDEIKFAFLMQAARFLINFYGFHAGCMLSRITDLSFWSSLPVPSFSV